MLNIVKHRICICQILNDIYSDSLLSPYLGFKGGTASYLFYNLPRFSVDLDFDFVSSWNELKEENKTRFLERITQTLSKKYTIVDSSLKYNTLFWIVSYEKGMRKIKVEISTRLYPNTYETRNFYGTTITVLQISDIIAHKLVAILERKELANRDLFDANYFLNSSFATQINYNIIEERTQKTPKEFFKTLLEYLNKVNNKNILYGLGELLDNKQKYWVKERLLADLKNSVALQLDSQ